jgi:hypothetical protein
MTFQIKKAVRKAIPAIICFYGKSGGGKTYSALKLAKGLVGKDRICLIDTENGRASHYADEFDFDVIDLEPPFTPARHIQAIKAAQDSGYKVIVIDSISNEWDGTGGCLEMAEGKQGLLAWAKPKEQHRKMMNMLLQSRSHIIFCARGKDNLEQTKINGRQEIVNHGLSPIQEKNFPFEMLITLKMEDKGKVVIEKCVKGLEDSLKIEGYIDESHGKIIADWVNQGEKVNLEAKQLMAEARVEAMKGVDIVSWVNSLDEKQKAIAKSFDSEFKKELVAIANEAKGQEDFEAIDSEQGIEIEQLLEKALTNKETFCGIYKINSIIDLPLAKFAEAKIRLEKKAAEVAGKKEEVKDANNN